MLREHRSAIIYLVAFIALFILCYLFPYVHDDWAWGSQIGIDRLNSGFSDYGGRYLGYILVMIMTRSKVLAALIMSGTLVGIGACIKRIVNSKWAFLVGLILIFLVSRETFAQSISWISGFANYATTTLVVLVFINILIDVFAGKKEKWCAVILAMLFGFAGSLILENVTLYLVAVSIISQIYLLVKKKQFSPVLFALMIGAGVGAAWMFSNSAYHNTVIGVDEYRSVSISIGETIRRIKENYLESIYPYGLLKNVILNVSLMISGLMLLILNKAKNNKTVMISFSMFFIYVVYTIVSEVIIGQINKPRVIIIIEAIITFIALVALISFCFTIKQKDSAFKQKSALIWLSYLIIIAPLFIITPIGPRNFLCPYVMLIAINLLWWREIFEDLLIHNKRAYQNIVILKKIGVLTTMTVWITYAGIFSIVSKADNERINNIREDIDNGSKMVRISPLPFESLMWQATPRDDVFKERYILFYDLPSDLEIQVDKK